MHELRRQLPGRPIDGLVAHYGLGTENQNLPGFVVLCPGLPVVGPQLWSSTLPAGGLPGHVHQSTDERDPKKLIQNIRNKQLSPASSARELDLLAKLEPQHIAAAGRRSATRGHASSRGDRLPHADRGAGRIRYHAGDRRRRASATATAISAAAA